MNGAAWERQIRYTLDVTRHYHNLLKLEEGQGRKDQTFYWDGNVAAMEEDGLESYYLQDDLGSPMQLLDENGEIRESYGFDEFGMSLFPEEDPGHQVQPFGYTGYQMEEAGEVYYAQARRYDAGTGRFVSEDKIKGDLSTPYTLNQYIYCWNNPEKYIDLNGKNAVEVLEWGSGLAGVVSQLDTPAPGPADLVALAILGTTFLIAGGVAIYEDITAKAELKAKEEEEVKSIVGDEMDNLTLIYRTGSGNGTNLTPREQDINGLSYSLTPPIGKAYTVTSIEQVNSTGVLKATIDGFNHVSVYPTNISELPIWIASRPNAKENPYYLTTILASISIKVRGGGGGCDALSN